MAKRNTKYRTTASRIIIRICTMPSPSPRALAKAAIPSAAAAPMSMPFQGEAGTCGGIGLLAVKVLSRVGGRGLLAECRNRGLTSETAAAAETLGGIRLGHGHHNHQTDCKNCQKFFHVLSLFPSGKYVRRNYPCGFSNNLTILYKAGFRESELTR